MNQVLLGSGLYILAGMILAYYLWLYESTMEETLRDAGKLHPFAPALTVIFCVIVWPYILCSFVAALWRRRRNRRPPSGTMGVIPGSTDLKFWEEADRKLTEKAAEYLRLNPACPHCGKEGTSAQEMGSIWVICSACVRRVCFVDPSIMDYPEHAAPPALCGPLKSKQCWVCAGPVEHWMPLQQVASGPDWTDLESVCKACVESGRLKAKRS